MLPISLKEEGDSCRLVIDPRYPNLTTQNCDATYESLPTFTKLLPRNIYLTKTDMTAGCHQLPLHPAMTPYVVITWDNTLYYFISAFFGETQTPKVFQDLTRHVTQQLKQSDSTFHPADTTTPRYTITHNYADGWVNVAWQGKQLAQQIHQHQINTITYYGPILSKPKTFPPSHRQIAQRLLVNTTSLTLSVPPKKHAKILTLLTTLAHTIDSAKPLPHQHMPLTIPDQLQPPRHRIKLLKAHIPQTLSVRPLPLVRSIGLIAHLTPAIEAPRTLMWPLYHALRAGDWDHPKRRIPTTQSQRMFLAMQPTYLVTQQHQPIHSPQLTIHVDASHLAAGGVGPLHRQGHQAVPKQFVTILTDLQLPHPQVDAMASSVNCQFTHQLWKILQCIKHPH